MFYENPYQVPGWFRPGEIINNWLRETLTIG
jgi:hypothetical protein